MEARNKAFLQLKPVCVKLSEVALKSLGNSGKPKDLIVHLEQLEKILRALSTQANILDNKLAEYIFFPLSSVLKQLENLPLTAKERTFECTLLLLQTAWRKNVAPELGMQLLILYTFVLDQESTRKSEELSTVLFKSVGLVCIALGERLVSAQSVPHLGKAISLILEDGILKGKSEEVQGAAVGALNAFVRSVGDRDALGTSFLPGIMSTLAKSLSGQDAKVSSNVIAKALEVLTYLLPLLFNDKFVAGLPDEDIGKKNQGLSLKWLKATVPQVKMAMTNILRLQAHDRHVVLLALGKLCTTLLQECSTSMEDSVSMLIEASLTIATKDESLEAELRYLLTTSTAFAETLQSSLHYWIMSLPRLMDSADETKKQRRIQQITLSFRLLNEQALDMSMINRDLAANLRDSVAGAIKDPSKKGQSIAVFETLPTMSLEVMKSEKVEVVEFENVIALQRSQADTVDALSTLARAISSHDSSLVAAQDLIHSVYNTEGDLQISSFWLTLNMVRSSLAANSEMDDFITFGNDGIDVKNDLLEQLYDFSISTLSDTSLTTETDWRLQALALECVALQAMTQAQGFRTELIDALYPVLHYLGSAIPALRSHAIITLNTIASACAYPTAGDLIISNVDYLVNAVALRLNSFDISPQAPQVLLMMVKLSGPRLLPYLDDTVESIFGVLEGFHGYPKLVDLLFRVLRVIVEEGAKAEQLTLEDGSASAHEKNGRQKLSIDGVVDLIKAVKRRYEDARNEKDDVPTETPEIPWGDETKPKEPEDGDGEAMSNDTKEPSPPAPRTYDLLLNISKLTQHYLTASSPELRTSLLDLLSSSFPALAQHENSFLPLINTLWPVLVPRLEDPEPYVVAGTLRVIGLMCRFAGDFMMGRVDEIWGLVMKVWRARTGRAGNPSTISQRSGGSAKSATVTTRFGGAQSVSSRDTTIATRAEDTQPAIAISSATDRRAISSVATPKASRQVAPQQHYIDAPSRIIWDALVEMLVNVVTYTATSDMLFDDVVEILVPVLRSRDDVKRVLETRNVDAVWLALYRLDGMSNATSQGEMSQPGMRKEDSSWRWAVV